MKQKSVVYLALALGFALTGLGIIWDLFKLVLFWLGAIAMPKDVTESLSEGRNVLNWLILQPWWVSALLNIACLCTGVWLIWWAVKSLVAMQKVQVVMPEGYMTSEEAQQLLAWHKDFRERLEEYQSQFAHKVDVVMQQINTADITAKFELNQIRSLVGDIKIKQDQLEADFPNTLLGIFNSQNSSISTALDILQRTQTVVEALEAKAAQIVPRSPQDTGSGTPQ